MYVAAAVATAVHLAATTTAEKATAAAIAKKASVGTSLSGDAPKRAEGLISCEREVDAEALAAGKTAAVTGKGYVVSQMHSH